MYTYIHTHAYIHAYIYAFIQTPGLSDADITEMLKRTQVASLATQQKREVGYVFFVLSISVVVITVSIISI